MSPPESIIKGAHFRQSICGKVALEEAAFLFYAKMRFRQIDEAAYFIDNAIIDYGYIDMYNTDITF